MKIEIKVMFQKKRAYAYTCMGMYVCVLVCDTMHVDETYVGSRVLDHLLTKASLCCSCDTIYNI